MLINQRRIYVMIHLDETGGQQVQITNYEHADVENVPNENLLANYWADSWFT